MSIYLADIRIKAAITLGLEDIAKNDWLLADILGDTVGNEYLRRFYSGQIESCKQWLANNRINVVMSDRDDKLEFPAVTIELGESSEKEALKHLGDLSTEKIHLSPNHVNKPIPYVTNPTSGIYITGNSQITGSQIGIFTFSSNVDLTIVAPGMVLADPLTGNGYVVEGVIGPNQIQLLPNLNLNAAKYGIIPKYQYYETRIGHSFFDETYKIGCHGMDQQTSLWLHSIVMYSLLRYRQVLLEADGAAQSMIQSTKMYPNGGYSDAGQVIWSRDITLKVQVENRWYMQPHRYIEDTAFPGGLKIISNITDTFEDLSTVNWDTLRDIANAGDIVDEE